MTRKLQTIARAHLERVTGSGGAFRRIGRAGREVGVWGAKVGYYHFRPAAHVIQAPTGQHLGAASRHVGDAWGTAEG